MSKDIVLLMRHMFAEQGISTSFSDSNGDLTLTAYPPTWPIGNPFIVTLGRNSEVINSTVGAVPNVNVADLIGLVKGQIEQLKS